MNKAAALWALAGVLVVAGLGVAQWGPEDLTKTYKYGLGTAIFLWVVAAVLIAVGTWSARGKRDQAVVAEAQADRDVARIEARDARSNYNALRAKEEELTRVRAEIGQQTAATMLTNLSPFTGAGGKLSALQVRAAQLEHEIRRLGG